MRTVTSASTGSDERLPSGAMVPAAPVVIIEGVSSARREVAPHLALAIWVHAPRAVRLPRGLERDGEAARPAWERWMAEEVPVSDQMR
jgi:uridine kinase